MKRNFFFSSLIILASVGFVACESDNDEPEIKAPASATPTEEFTFGSCQDEQYVEDAIKINVIPENDTQAEFSSIELFGDGHYLITRNPNSNSSQRTVSVQRETDGSTTVFKSHNTKRLATRATDNNETISIDNGNYEYGSYTREQEGVYRFSDNSTLDIREMQEQGTVTYTHRDGRKSKVYIQNEEANDMSKALSNLCRSWRHDSFEIWCYLNGAYIAHVKQWLADGRVSQKFSISPGAKKWGFEEDDFLEPASEYCYRIIFSKHGTYVCFYMNGEIEVERWRWLDSNYGTLHYWDPTEFDYDDSGELTVRFKGNQMRVYENTSEREDGITTSFISVNTFTAGY